MGPRTGNWQASQVTVDRLPLTGSHGPPGIVMPIVADLGVLKEVFLEVFCEIMETFINIFEGNLYFLYK
jgi:hypothetical protein